MKTMASTRIAAWSCAVVALLCLVGGFGLKGYWAILIVFPALAVYGWLLRKNSPRISASILFFIYVILATVGLLKNISPYFMLIGSSSALAAWESFLFLLNFQGAGVESADPRLERSHNRDLALAIGSGCLLSLLGLNLYIRLPFGVVAVLALLAVYGLYRGLSMRSRTL